MVGQYPRHLSLSSPCNWTTIITNQTTSLPSSHHWNPYAFTRTANSKQRHQLFSTFVVHLGLRFASAVFHRADIFLCRSSAISHSRYTGLRTTRSKRPPARRSAECRLGIVNGKKNTSHNLTHTSIVALTTLG